MAEVNGDHPLLRGPGISEIYRYLSSHFILNSDEVPCHILSFSARKTPLHLPRDHSRVLLNG